MPFRTRLNRFLGRFDVHMREVLRGSVVALALKILGAFLSFTMTVVIGRMLGAQGTGVFFLALSVVTIASVLGKVGMDNALLRFTAAHSSQEEWGHVKGVARMGLRFASIALGISAAVVFITAQLIAEHVFDEPALSQTLRIMAIAILPLGLFQLLAQLLRGLKRIFHSVLVQSIWLPAITTVGLFLFVPAFGVNGAALAYLVGTVATLIIGAGLWGKGISRKSGKAAFSRSELLASSKPLFAVAATHLALIWASTLILGIYHPSDQVGIFSAANRTAKLLVFVFLAINFIASPKFATLYREGDLEAIGRVARSSATLLALAALPGLLIFVAFPTKVLAVYGPEFIAGGYALIIISIGHYVNVATGLVGSLLMMTGHERLMRNVMIITATIAIILNFALIPEFGVTGAAIATAVALIFQNLSAAILVRKRLGIWSLPLFNRPVTSKGP